MAEALVAARLRRSEIAMAVSSAGTLGWRDRPATDKALQVLDELSAPLVGHTSTKLDATQVAGADLIVVMTRVHGWAVTAHDPEAVRRTFLPDELHRLGGAAPRQPDESLRAWAERVVEGRTGDQLGHARDEIADPAGESMDTYRQVAVRLDRFAARLVDAIAPGSGGADPPTERSVSRS